ncbi:MAG TPA: dipeptidase [Spirochaetia bacterium]|nr:dipeptidase [Spirochaetia bacterium]
MKPSRAAAKAWPCLALAFALSLSIPAALSSCAGRGAPGQPAAGGAAGPSADGQGGSDEALLQARAKELALRLPVVDTHIDYPEVRKPAEDLLLGTSGNFDHPRAVAGGLDAAFLSIFVPAEDEEAGKAFAKAEERLSLIEADLAAHPEALALAASPEEVARNAAAGRLSLALGLENAAPIEGRLERVAAFRKRGVSYVTLCHLKNNHVCDSANDESGPRWGGLSPFGRELVAELNARGVMVDLSHVSEAAFWEALALTKAPPIASHSGLRSFTPGFERNLSDEMLAALAAKGGVVQIPFGSSFLSEKYRQTMSYMALATVRDVALVVDRAVQVAGVDHVGIGSDFDGVGFSLPRELRDVSMYPNLVRELLRLGYSEEAIGKILGGNILRVWGEAIGAGRLP